MKNYRRFSGFFAVLILNLSFNILFSPGGAQGSEKTCTHGNYLVYIGTYTGPNSKGIYAYRFDPATGGLTSLGLAAETTNPSFLAVDPIRRFLYAVNEIGNYQGGNSGGVSAFSIDRATGKLKLLNEVPSRGADPCFVSLDKSGKYVLVANYTGGSVAVFPVLKDGRLGEATAFDQHHGQSVNRERQLGPHAHMISVTPVNRFALAADLGLDELLVYRFDETRGALETNEPPFVKVHPGDGPRHFAFHPNGKFVYLISEMGGTVATFSYDEAGGVLTQLQRVSTLPKDFQGQNTAAEIAVHPSGKFLYASNRGHDSIAVFAIDPRKGTLTLIEHVSTQGKTPRNFAIDPTGSFLIAANQDSNNIVIFRIDPKTGRLTPTGKTVDLQSPACVTFVGE
ncbi:MAG TPA: lactonase family protein [Terriglobia bacterium]|nr:lactonase family protein [Terriglobia bacterium]